MHLFFYVGLNRDEEQTLRPSLATNILPGTSKAVLTLANGQMIPLGKEAADSTIITDGTQINASGSGVTYASGGESESIVYNKLEIPRGGEFLFDTFRWNKGVVELGNFYPVSGSLRGKGTAGFRARRGFILKLRRMRRNLLLYSL